MTLQSDGRKPAHESWESFTERRIREAQENGAFEDLPGFGRPLADVDRPLDENWWLKDQLRRENLSALPPILEARLDLEKTLAAVSELTSEYQVRKELRELNDRIQRAHFSIVAGPADGVPMVDIEAVVTEWRNRRSMAAGEADTRTS